MPSYSESSWADLEPVLSRLVRGIGGRLNLMEVCGTHTAAILKHGFRAYFAEKINFLSGPGCPVCVTDSHDIDRVIALADKGVTLVTFGDLMKVPGSRSSLAAKRAEGREIHVVYSPLDALDIARGTRSEVAFVAIGFETTAPSIAAMLEEVVVRRIANLSLYPLLKTIPNALAHLLTGREHRIDGLICPGHVSAIIGEEPYAFIPERFAIPCVISGFGRADIAAGILSLLRQMEAGIAKVDNRYARVVKPQGNPRAREYISRFFQAGTAGWRGLGEIPSSGLCLRPEYAGYDVANRVPIQVEQASEAGHDCLCDRIICGLAAPGDCPRFDRECTPDHPLGPCMVSGEGSCHADYLYGRR